MNTTGITISTSDKIGLISNLSTMLSAGISIIEAVDSLLEDSKGNSRKILEVLRSDLMGGKRLHASFARFPLVFDKVTVNIIRAAEEAGTLDVTLKDLRTTIVKDVEFSDKVKSAMIYPIIIVIVFFGVLFMILIFVIPRISTVFSRMNVVLPLPTRIMIFVSNLLLHYTIPSVGVMAIVAYGSFWMYRHNKRMIMGILFSLPVVSDLAKEIDLTRFTRSMALLLNAGIPITSALELSSEVVMKNEIQKVIVHSREIVLSGRKLSDGFKLAKNIMPSIMIKITEAGEKSGSLDRSMQEISDYLDYQVSKTLRTAMALLEPIMLVFVGIIVGAMMLAIIAPIYGLIGQLGGGAR